MTDHKFQPEATNAGHYFCDCSCGLTFGVYPSRADAKRAHAAHVAEERVPDPVKPTLQISFDRQEWL